MFSNLLCENRIFYDEQYFELCMGENIINLYSMFEAQTHCIFSIFLVGYGLECAIHLPRN